MKIVLFKLLFFTIVLVNAQAPQRFYTRFGGDGDDIAYSGKQTFDKQYIVAGSSSSYGVAGNTDVYLVKVDSMGFPSWQKFIGGAGNDIGRSVIQLADTGFVIAGYTNSFGAGGYDVYVIRTDKNGNVIWQKTFGGTDWEFAYDVVQASDGNLFVVGNTQSFGNGKMDAYLIKLDLNGNLLLQKTYGGTENEELKSIIKTNDNNLVTVGYTESRGDVDGDGYFAKLDLNGDTLFTRTFGGPYKDFASDVVQKGPAENFDYYIGGAKTYSLNAKTHSYIRRLNSVGLNITDTSYFRNQNDEEFVSVANSKTIPYFTCFARSVILGSNAMQEEAFMVWPDLHAEKVNAGGGPENEFVYSIESTFDGGFLSVGSTLGFNSKSIDVFFVKRDSTIINYSSVVGVIEDKKNDRPLLLMLENKLIISSAYNAIKNVRMIEIDGKIVMDHENRGSDFEFDTSGIEPGIYVLTIWFINGQVAHYKIVI